jgi:hypothetical protein
MSKITKLFDASMFLPTKFSTAEDKALFGNRLIAFIEEGFPEHLFTNAFYSTLCQTFSFIAHYNREGFRDFYFTNTTRKIEFLNDILRNPCWGDPQFTFSDVEKAIQTVLIERQALLRLNVQNRCETEQAERNMLARLKSKYEFVDPQSITNCQDEQSAIATSDLTSHCNYAVQGSLF